MASKKKRVAVIGSGLAGLTTAYLLNREGLEVWLIEKSDTFGFHSASVDVPIPIPIPRTKQCKKAAERRNINTIIDNEKRFRNNEVEDEDLRTKYGEKEQEEEEKGMEAERWIVDVPMRSFQGGYYPLLISLYRHLGIPLTPTFYTFSFSSFLSSPSHPSFPSSPSNKTESPSSETYFIYSGASGLSIPSLPSKYLHNPITLIKGIWMFITTAACFLIWMMFCFLGYHDILPNPLGRSTTLREFKEYTSREFYRWSITSSIGKVWMNFIDNIIIPMFGAVGTMTIKDVEDTPIGALVDYVHTTIGTSHYSLPKGMGATKVAELLANPLRQASNPVILRSECEEEAGGVKESGQGGYVRLGETITGLEVVQRKEGGEHEVLVRFVNGEDILVDQVVIATQASAAKVLLGMLEDSLSKLGEKRERKRVLDMLRGLENVQYRESIVVTHRDKSILPPTADIREINLLTPRISLTSISTFTSKSNQPDSLPEVSLMDSQLYQTRYDTSKPPPYDKPQKALGGIPYFAPRGDRVYTMGTHVIAPPNHLSSRVEGVLQTTNPVVPISSETVLGVARLERALPLRNPLSTLSQLHPPTLQDNRDRRLVFIAGSYAYPGIPLLEGCVGSAIRVTREITGRTGGVDWQIGRGDTLLGRIWRWRSKRVLGSMGL